MKSAVRLLAVFAIAILAGFVSQAQTAPDCGENTGKKATGKPIPIGAVTTMSGIGSFKEADDAVRAYFDCVNANGGIHGRPITYHDEDDQSQLDVAAQAAKKLVGDEGVYAMIGSTSIIECIPNANYYLKENIVEIGEGIPPQCYQSKNIAEVNAARARAASPAPTTPGGCSGQRASPAPYRNSPAPTGAAAGSRSGARNSASR